MKKLLFLCIAVTSFLGVQAQAPGGISTGLELWLKGNAGITGSAPITAWADQSGNAVANSVSGNPALATAALNFNDVITFDGSGDYFTTGLTVNEATFPDLSVIAVYVPAVNSSGAIWGEDDGNWDRFLLDGNTTSLNDLVSNGSGAITGIDNIYVTNTPVVTTVLFDEDAADGSYVYANANEELNFTSNHGPESSNSFQVGALGVNNFHFNGTIAECIVYSQVLSAADRNQVESYLAIKYGITLSNSGGGAAGDYTSSGGTLLWNADNYVTYHHDVTGIGRDDNAALDQQKSISSNDGARVIIDKGGAFGADGDFILWGNDNQGVSLSTANAHPSHTYILEQTWIASVAGTPGPVSVSFIFPNNGVPADFALLMDAGDTDFSAGAQAHTTGASISGDTITFTGVNFTDSLFFTLGTNYLPPSPGGVSDNLELWMKADDGVTGASPISAWTDQSYHRVSNAVSGNPQLTAAGLNFNDVITFDGTGDYFTTGLDISEATFPDLSVIAVYEPSINTSGGVWGEDDGNWDRFIIDGNSSNLNNTVSGGTGPLGEIDRIFVPDTAVITSVLFDEDATNGSYVYANANEETNFTANHGPESSNSLQIGALGVNDYHFNGNIAECIVYSQLLSAADRNKVESYLAIKYGITLSNSGGGTAGDYAASDGTQVWDADNSAGYHHDVIGIGRDDAQDLYQKQSKSVDDSLFVYTDNLAADNASNAGTIANDAAFVFIGHNGGALKATATSIAESPSGVNSRFAREWKITNTNFTDAFSLTIEWDSSGAFDINSVRLLVDSDGDFSDATVLSSLDGLSFSVGSIRISGISASHIPVNSTRYITVGSADMSTPLPIELLRFTARESALRTVALQWQTATEINNDYFTLERSPNAKNWTAIARVDGAGNTTSTRSYAYTDQYPLPGISYYRLKQTDFDGTFSFSRVSSVNMAPALQPALNIYPNPTKGIVHIPGNVGALSVYNVLGEDVTGFTDEISRSETLRVISLTRLSPGVYMFRTPTAAKRVYKH